MEEHIMTKTNQKEAVYNAVINVVGEQDGAYTPTKEQRAQVNQILFTGFREDAIELDREFTDTELKGYVSGLQSNWLRKDGRLNGGVKYQAKNPGSRAGSGDPQIKAMRILLAGQTDPQARTEIQAFINKRQAEVKPTTKQVTLSAEQIAALTEMGLGHFVK
jgi:hypothetical protein